MFFDKAYTLIKQLERNQDYIPPYNLDLVNEISKETELLTAQNQRDILQTRDQSEPSRPVLKSTVKVRHTVAQRNLRCLLAYHYNRLMCLKTMRWEFGSVLPANIKSNLNSSELEWLSNYSLNLGEYMRSVGDNDGVNLEFNLQPPKSLHIQVLCLIDYGRYELNSGIIIHLKKNSRHYLPRSECEELIKKGVLQHIE